MKHYIRFKSYLKIVLRDVYYPTEKTVAYCRDEVGDPLLCELGLMVPFNDELRIYPTSNILFISYDPISEEIEDE